MLVCALNSVFGDSDWDANGCRHGLAVTAPIFVLDHAGFTMAD